MRRVYRVSGTLLAALISQACHGATQTELRNSALAECLIKQNVSSSLREEGYRLGEIAIHRAGVDPSTWGSLDKAVDAEIARRPMLTTHIDAPVAQSDRPVPLVYCLDVVDSPPVQAAMAKLIGKRGTRR